MNFRAWIFSGVYHPQDTRDEVGLGSPFLFNLQSQIEEEMWAQAYLMGVL